VVTICGVCSSILNHFHFTHVTSLCFTILNTFMLYLWGFPFIYMLKCMFSQNAQMVSSIIRIFFDVYTS
jgi:hypothetical protein